MMRTAWIWVWLLVGIGKGSKWAKAKGQNAEGRRSRPMGNEGGGCVSWRRR